MTRSRSFSHKSATAYIYYLEKRACASPKRSDVFCERQFFFLSSNSTQDIYSTRNATTLLEKVAFMTGKEKKLVQRDKYKRDDRGSSEEGNSAAKKHNMAACEASPDDNETEGVFEPSEEKEISLNELKALLEGVQHTLLEMRTENQRMLAEITDLKSSFKNHSMEISDLKTVLLLMLHNLRKFSSMKI